MVIPFQITFATPCKPTLAVTKLTSGCQVVAHVINYYAIIGLIINFIKTVGVSVWVQY